MPSIERLLLVGSSATKARVAAATTALVRGTVTVVAAVFFATTTDALAVVGPARSPTAALTLVAEATGVGGACRLAADAGVGAVVLRAELVVALEAAGVASGTALPTTSRPPARRGPDERPRALEAGFGVAVATKVRRGVLAGGTLKVMVRAVVSRLPSATPARTCMIR